MRAYFLCAAFMFLLAVIFGLGGLYLMYLSIPYAVAPVFLSAAFALFGFTCVSRGLPDDTEEVAPASEVVNEKTK